MAGPSSQGSLLFSLMSRRNLMKAHEILNNPFLNKGTAFTMEEREKLGLIGLLPPHVQTIEEQAAQTYAQMEKKENDLEKRLFLMQIFNTNRTLFYYLFSKHLAEFTANATSQRVASNAWKNSSRTFKSAWRNALKHKAG